MTIEIDHDLRDIYKVDSSVFRKVDGSLDRFGFSNNIVEYATSRNLPIRDVFKQFAKQHFLDFQNVKSGELLELAYGLYNGQLLPGLLLVIHALDITQDTAATRIPELFPKFSIYDRATMATIWYAEDLLGWPRGITYPQVKTYG